MREVSSTMIVMVKTAARQSVLAALLATLAFVPGIPARELMADMSMTMVRQIETG
jgi:hypothetical protein